MFKVISVSCCLISMLTYDMQYAQDSKRAGHGGCGGNGVDLCTALSDVGVDVGRERGSA